MNHNKISFLSEYQEKRFWSKIDIQKSKDCWNWLASLRGGVGSIRIQGKHIPASRLAYFLGTGIDPGELCVSHTCKNSLCCNPAHLQLKSHIKSNTREYTPLPNFTTGDVGRFWSKVDIQKLRDCWNWLACIRAGYGRFRIQNCLFNANRVAYYLDTGIDPKFLRVCHTCDNPLCCNPQHLWVGSDVDNAGDRDEKNRLIVPRLPGSLNPAAKFTETQVKQIRQQVKNGQRISTLAHHYGVADSTIYNIINRKTWSHV